MGLDYECRNNPIAVSSGFIEDLWPEVFKRLPVKTLSRFQCVCKNWKSIITSSSLIASHRSLASVASPNNKPYLQIDAGGINHNSYTLHKSNAMDDLRFPFRFAGNLAGRHPNDVYQLKIYRMGPFPKGMGRTKTSSLNFTCVDIIHGVVCISYSSDSGFDSTILWNPSIHKYISLPKAGFHLDHYDDYSARFLYHAIGLGYDESKKDYKVARIWAPCHWTKRQLGSNAMPICEVYSCREGRWRRVPAVAMDNGVTHVFRETWSLRTSCCVNGRIHWVTSSGGGVIRRFVVVLDCESEEMSMMELPSEMIDYGRAKPTIPMVLNYASMLSVVVNFEFPCWGSVVELWAMKEYGETGTWQKLYRFQKEDIVYGSSLFEAPYGPLQWRRLCRHNFWFYEVLSFHVFEESMCLMDDSNARSYTKEEEVEILVT